MFKKSFPLPADIQNDFPPDNTEQIRATIAGDGFFLETSVLENRTSIGSLPEDPQVSLNEDVGRVYMKNDSSGNPGIYVIWKDGKIERISPGSGGGSVVNNYETKTVGAQSLCKFGKTMVIWGTVRTQASSGTKSTAEVIFIENYANTSPSISVVSRQNVSDVWVYQTQGMPRDKGFVVGAIGTVGGSYDIDYQVWGYFV